MRGWLLERERELAALDRLIARAPGGDGQLVVVDGPAGIGKTSLLEEARRRAADAGASVAFARGGELEVGFPYGVVRQLLEPVLRHADVARVEEWLAGPARVVEPMLLGRGAGASTAVQDPQTVRHGLYWLVANLAAERPMVIMVDDAQWSDSPSLRFLAHLARRLDGLPVAVVASVRTGEPSPDPVALDDLRHGPAAQTVSPAPLSQAAVATLLAGRVGQPPDDQFAEASHTLTGGNPFLVVELVAVLEAEGLQPSAALTSRLASLNAESIGHATLSRIGRLSDDAAALARTLAALGGDATTRRALELTGLDDEAGATAWDALERAGVLTLAGGVQFVHPIVGTAVYGQLGAGERSHLHGRIAALLERDGADLDAVAGHLLRTIPGGRTQAIATLRAAAAHALAMGDPGSAARYLERAVEEGCDRELRIALLLELALAERVGRSPSALTHLEEIRRLSDDPAIRARAAIEHVQIQIMSGEWKAPLALATEALDELGEQDPALALQLITMRAAITAYDPRLIADFERRLPALQAIVGTGVPGARPLAMLLAGIEALRGASEARVRDLFEQGWDGGGYLSDGVSAELLPQGVVGLVITDATDRARDVVRLVSDAARERGSVSEFIIAAGYAALLAARSGNLVAAEAELRSGCERATEFGLLFALPTLLVYGVDVLLERPETADLAALAEAIDPGPMAEVMSGALVLWVRGRLKVAAQNGRSGVDDLRRAHAITAALHCSNPNLVPWRSSLALALPRDAHAEATELARTEYDDARRIGRPRGIGIALRALGALHRREPDGTAYLRQSVDVLASSTDRLELARSLVALGADLRRRGSRSAARDPLRTGLDLAIRSGAMVLADEARRELKATGARPRRGHLTGLEALTPSELRVADLAATGLTTPDIAQALFVSTKTIDTHLAHVYRKLGIRSRTELPQALRSSDHAG